MKHTTSVHPLSFSLLMSEGLMYNVSILTSWIRGPRDGKVAGGDMPSRHETVTLRARNRHVSVTSLPQPAPPALWQLDLVNQRLCRGEETLALTEECNRFLPYLLFLGVTGRVLPVANPRLLAQESDREREIADIAR
jgi:hypothetical protein